MSFNLLFPEWHGYASNQDVYHGALHLCRHVAPDLEFSEIDTSVKETLEIQDGVIGRDPFLKLLDQASSILNTAKPKQIFMVGGTCACEIAPVTFLNEFYDGDLAVLWFDAHGDLNTPESSPSNRLHGMPLRSLLGEGDSLILERITSKLNPSQVALVGSRDLDSGELAYIKIKELPIFLPTSETSTWEIIDFIKSRGFSNVYIHFDLDALEPNEFPHVLVPTPDGISINTSVSILQALRKNFNVVGSSIVEYCPKDGGGLEQLNKLIVEGFGITL